MALSQFILIFCSLTLSQCQTAIIGPDHDSEVDGVVPENCTSGPVLELLTLTVSS